LNLIEQLDQLLPQTQCQRCGYPACRPYAEAMAEGEAAPNRCPPGGQEGVKALASLLGQAEIDLDLSRGTPGVGTVVKIDQAFCIGCTKCIRACPVDAIMGANKRMHTVIADLCTGCELCIPPCPTDCISIEPRQLAMWEPQDALSAQARYLSRITRLAKDGFESPAEESDELEEANSLVKTGRVEAGRGEASQVEPKQPQITMPDVRQAALTKALTKALDQARARLASRTQGENNASG
jgi:Na+-translocating ferredoxin:NAD+ oxidoreductase subunit B